MRERSHYEVLGVSRGAGPEEIHARYLDRLHEVHPDLNLADADGAHERTIEVVTAYRVLSDPAERRRYDFRTSNPFRADGELPGLKLLKGRAKADAEERFREAQRHLQADDLVRAVEPLKAALEAVPEYPAAVHNLALAAALLGQAPHALDVLDRGLKRNPADASLKKLRSAIAAAFLTVD